MAGFATREELKALPVMAVMLPLLMAVFCTASAGANSAGLLGTCLPCCAEPIILPGGAEVCCCLPPGCPITPACPPPPAPPPLPAAAAAKASACVHYSDGEIAAARIPTLPLPLNPSYKLGGNAYGVGGRKTTMRQCAVRDDAARTFGWNWTRGETSAPCVVPGTCKAPDCFADFSLASLSHGIGPWADASGASGASGGGGGGGGGGGRSGGSSGGGSVLPADSTKLAGLLVTQNVTWSWTDEAPAADPPATGAPGSRRVRLIYDFFLTRSKPNGTNIASTITDEIVINLASNADFPGSQPPGCRDPNSKFSNHSAVSPVLKNAVYDGHHFYDYYYTDHHDAVPGTGSRYSSFRRVGGDVAGAQAPAVVNLIPFLAAVSKMWPNEQVGPWIGAVSIATEIYDHSSGSVTFHNIPTFYTVPKV